MEDYRVQRAYARTDNWAVSAKVAKDESAGKWSVVKVSEISAGGLLFHTDTAYQIGDQLWFHLHIDPMIPGIYEFEMKVKGEMKHRREHPNGVLDFGVAFVKISDDQRIELDELVLKTAAAYKRIDV